jgi:TPR repeat protein
MNFSHAQTGIFNTEGMTENQKYMLQSAMYRKGLGVPQDLVLSAQYMEKAALGGDALAQGLFGDMNEFGIGVPRNYEVAAHWYEKSVTNGSTYAYLNLAIMYFEGRGVAKNLDKAEAYFKKSLLQERSVVAVYNLGILYLNHNRYAEAEALLLEAKQKGLKNMDTALATCYDKLKKYDKSIPLWKTMAQQGQPEGMVEMAYHYKQGQGVPINHHKAYYLSGMAAKRGDRMEDGNVSLL